MILLLVFGDYGSLYGQPKSLEKTYNTTDSFDSHALQKAWLLFANAVKAGNKNEIRALSTACINCVDCLTNTPREDSINMELRQMHPDKWYDMMYRQLCFIKIGEFITDDLPIIFDEHTKARLLDPSKIVFARNDHNARLYENQCIAKAAQRRKAAYSEVLVTVIDPSASYEGSQKAFAFIKIGNSFKFCGYSLIP